MPAGVATVVVDGTDERTGQVADRLAAALDAAGRPCTRLPSPTGDVPDTGAVLSGGAVVVADGPTARERPPAGGWDVVVWLRTSRRQHAADGARGDTADVVVDLHDPEWPVIRHVAPRLLPHERWHLAESRAFFGVRADTWDAKFGDDLPAYAAAVEAAALPPGGVVVDVGCGTGRALPALRAAVGPTGTVIGLDHTPQMLAKAREKGNGGLVLADAGRLPFADGSVDAVFAAGLVMHLPDPADGLRELARVTRPGGRLVLFHPTGRATLAARHGRVLRADEPLAEGPLTATTAASGWRLTTYDDGADRFLALADRTAHPAL
ncbi:methyltransferase domain-containing protein [Dactylosporangium aurantiacum]|uniref:Methyltransferase domain-containing protein n=1 Tax=Dactylosporangium aurantiacum TaxID=35754 RepID=A0A9Q9IQS1_9ACTN|nr:methyltransferase domain-containing protein [Dactylosporangium aurantiacum]